jgi:hypothetical protein
MLKHCIAVFVVGLFLFSSPLYGQQPVAPSAPIAHAHAHPEHGPHGGELLEVGKEEYHIELVIEEKKKELTVYLLDGQVKKFVAIDAPFLAVNLKMVGKPVQVKLLSIPQDVDKKGFSSRFGITHPQMLDALHGGHADARLALKIGNKAYAVKIVHNHDHAGHSHGPAISKKQ